MKNRILVIVIGLLPLGLTALAEDRPYLCEIGLQGGCGYYVGEAAPHIFQNVQWTAGGHFRYKITNRWSVKVNGMYQVIEGPYQDYREPNNKALADYRLKNGLTADSRWQSKLVNIDATAECNFLRFGMPELDGRAKPYTPYIFFGVGCGIIPGPKGDFSKAVAYIPLGIGFKWQFVKWGALHLAWQHNICCSDDLENVWMEDEKGNPMNPLGNTYNLNKSNIMNMDVTSQLTLGIVFAFAQRRKVCRLCEKEDKRYGL